MTCMGASNDVQACMESDNVDVHFPLLAASDLPDALAFGKFNMSASASNNLCTDLSYLHSASFGAFMVVAAQQLNSSQIANFAIGFMGHVLGDMVGFFNNSGILCAKHVGACNQNILYIPLWTLMLDIDAMVLARFPSVTPAFLPTVGLVDPAAVQFLAHQSHLYNSQIDSSFAPTTAAAVNQCIQFWQANQKFVHDLAHRKQSTHWAELQDELLFFTGLKNTSSLLTAQTRCGGRVVARALADIAQCMGPLQVQSDAAHFTAQLYAQGVCH